MCQMSIESDKKTYLLYSRLFGYKKRIVNAAGIVNDALSLADKWIMAFSGGKDSIVMLDIAYKAGFRGDLLHFYYSEFENTEENQELCRKYAHKYKLALHEIKVMSCKDIWDEVSYFYCTPSTPEEKRLARAIDRDYRKKSTEFCRENGYAGLMMGIRKDESNTRKMALSIHGDTYYAKCRDMITCCPNSNLTDEDIWAYIFDNELPYLNVYDNPYFDRRKTRNELVFMSAGKAAEHGLLTNYNLLYPEIVQKLKDRYGNLPEMG